MDGCALTIRGAFMHNRALVSGHIFMHRRSIMPGITLHRTALLSVCALLHMRSGLMTGTAFLYRPDLLCLCRSLAAGMTGRRRLRNSHDERGAEETCHQCNCQYFL